MPYRITGLTAQLFTTLTGTVRIAISSLGVNETGNVYGGGNQGAVEGNTQVLLKD